MPIADVDEVAGDCGGGGHLRADEMGARARALAPLEVAVAGGGAALAGGEDVRVHAQAHGAAGLAPLESRIEKDAIQALLFGLCLDGLRAGHDHRADFGMHMVAGDDFGGGAQVLDAGVGAGADEDAVDGDLLDGLAGLEGHIFQRALEASAPLVAVVERTEGDGPGDGHDHAGVGFPADLRGDVLGLENEFAIEGCSLVGGEGLPVGDGFFPLLALWREAAAFQVGEGGLVGSDHAGAGSGLDAHVADGHAAFHREGADRRAGVFDDMPGRPVGADAADDGEHDVLGGDGGGEFALDGDAEGLRLRLRKGLRGQDVLDLGGADAKCKGAECAVGRGVGVAADDSHAGLGDPELRADDVDDALLGRVDVVELDAELLAVLAQGVDLLGGDLVGDDEAVVFDRRDVVVHGRDAAVGAPHGAPFQAQPLEGLGRGDLVDEVQVDVEDRRFTLGRDHEMRVPDFFEERFGGVGHWSSRLLVVSSRP